MKKVTVSVLTAVATIALTCPAFAADEYQKSLQDQVKQSDQMGQSDQMKQSGQMGQMGQSEQMRQSDQLEQSGQLRAGSSPTPEKLKGMKVLSQQGEEIGKIQDVKKDPQTGEVSHVTVSKGGVLGIGSQKSAVPLEAFTFSSQTDEAILTVDESKLDNAPQQAKMPDQEFQRELQSYYGISPAFQQDQQRRPTDNTPETKSDLYQQGDKHTPYPQQSPDIKLKDSKKQ
jgi:sporulation protein YlmC with PRC-barrel domain